MKKVLLVLAVAALVTPTFAAVIDQAEARPVGQAASIGQGASRYDLVYSNVDTVTAAYSRPFPPAAEIGDDLFMNWGGYLDEVQFSVYNSSSSLGELTAADLTLKFYNYNYDTTLFDYVGGIGWTGVTFSGMAPGYYTTFQVTDLSSYGILLDSYILATLTIDNLQGGATRVGQVLANPPAIGYSDDLFYRDGGWYWFSGNPVANFYWEIGTSETPEPASLALLGLASLLIRRR